MRKKQILTEFLLFPFVALVVACGKNLDLALPFPNVGDASKFTRPSKALHRCKIRVALRQYSFFQSLVNFDGIRYSTLHINNEGVTLRREFFVKIQTATSKGKADYLNRFATLLPASSLGRGAIFKGKEKSNKRLCGRSKKQAALIGGRAGRKSQAKIGNVMN
jgi:hypothetical protein